MTDFNFICQTCKTIEWLGVGSFTNWMVHCYTVEEFDASPESEQVRSMAKNQRLRDCLSRHAGHDHRCLSMDFYSVNDSTGALEVDTPLGSLMEIPDYAAYRDVTPKEWMNA